MSTQDIINGIIARRNEIDDAEAIANREVWEKIEALEDKIRSLAPRLKGMYEVAKALSDNSFWLGGKSRYYGQRSPEFLTDSIDHRVGFFVKHPYFDSLSRNYTLTGYFGIANGGAYGEDDLEISIDGEVKQWDFNKCRLGRQYDEMRDRYLCNLSAVVNAFDKFESDFYAYAKNPIPRSTRL